MGYIPPSPHGFPAGGFIEVAGVVRPGEYVIDVTTLDSPGPVYMPIGVSRRPTMPIRSAYDPKPTLRQAAIGAVLLAALVVSAGAVVWSAITGWGW